jgi:hypothetical protein
LSFSFENYKILEILKNLSVRWLALFICSGPGGDVGNSCHGSTPIHAEHNSTVLLANIMMYLSRLMSCNKIRHLVGFELLRAFGDVYSCGYEIYKLDIANAG